ncbi:MAG: hypothetical protein IMY73_02570 [Bacteroidetes bacterium]|nr:hypothetical protein [Bacteroidota bacterium]
MEKYMNIKGNSNVCEYEIFSNKIEILFYGTCKKYTYSYSSAGKDNVDHMKELAIAGFGLNSFINLFVKNEYEK